MSASLRPRRGTGARAQADDLHDAPVGYLDALDEPSAEMQQGRLLRLGLMDG
jgi:hypothetical protein